MLCCGLLLFKASATPSSLPWCSGMQLSCRFGFEREQGSSCVLCVQRVQRAHPLSFCPALCQQVSHTEPDHSYLVPAVLDLYPEATVVASKVALNFLAGLTNRWAG